LTRGCFETNNWLMAQSYFVKTRPSLRGELRLVKAQALRREASSPILDVEQVTDFGDGGYGKPPHD
jgi:hypothetical protein